MVRINFDIDNYLYAQYLDIVGKGNISADLREYIQSKTVVLPKSYKQRIAEIDKQLQDIQQQIKALQKKYSDLESIKNIEEKKQKEKWKKVYDTSIHDNLQELL